jgi:UDP:flavonoid glycosyltransferase YjiC (YdhE family)
MARILFIWEMGDHFGHLLSYRALIENLVCDGHEVVFYVKRIENARRVYDSMGIRLREMPPLKLPPRPPYPRPNSYAEVLLNTAFHDLAQARARVAAWRRILLEEHPDKIVFDFSPSAMLANRTAGIPAIVAGNTFSTPPAVTPLPALRYWEVPDRERMQRNEACLLENLNACVESSDRRLASVAELFNLPVLLRTFEELDHYPSREHGRYVGSFAPADYGVPVVWPKVDGPRVFAYLQPCAATSAVLAELGTRSIAAVVYAPELLRKDRPSSHSRRVHYTAAPAHMATTAAQADLVVTNGNLGTTAAALAAGCPVLMAANTLEKYIVARRVEALGAGLAVTAQSARLVGIKLDALLGSRGYRRAAERFRSKYAHWTAAVQWQAMRAALDSLPPALDGTGC